MPASSAQPRSYHVTCFNPAGLHRMAVTEWGDPANPRVLVCVHGLTRCGRDFDVLAQRLCSRYRVVCPDIVGRGNSDWLTNPNFYVVPQYVSDIVTLLAHLGATTFDWFGTSLGGLIGMGLAGLPQSPIRRIVLNDIGPHLEPVALDRIALYLGQAISFASEQEGIDYLAALAPGFGSHTLEEWRALNRPLLLERDGRWVPRYDPAIAVPFQTLSQHANPQLMDSTEESLWKMFEAMRGPTLVVRGEQSDLLSRATVTEMVRRGQQVSSVEIPGVGHAPTFIHEDQLKIAQAFLDGQD